MKMKNIKILVKTTIFESEPTLVYPEKEKIASEYIPEVWKHIKENDDVMIVTCSDHVVNTVGLLILEGFLHHDEVELWVENELYNYGEDGLIINWDIRYFFSPDVRGYWNV